VASGALGAGDGTEAAGGALGAEAAGGAAVPGVDGVEVWANEADAMRATAAALRNRVFFIDILRG